MDVTNPGVTDPDVAIVTNRMLQSRCYRFGCIRMSTRMEKMRYRIAAVELLKLAKEKYTYRYLSRLTGITVTELSRYVRGHIIPYIDRAMEISPKLVRLINLREKLGEAVVVERNGYVDTTRIIGDPYLLKLATLDAVQKFAGRRVTKILTAASDGISLSSVMAQYMGVKLAVAKKERENEEEDEGLFYEGNTNGALTLYLQKRSIGKREDLLIVDDVVRTGRTLSSLVSICRQANAGITGAYILIGVGERWKENIDFNYLPESSIEVICYLRP